MFEILIVFQFVIFFYIERFQKFYYFMNSSIKEIWRFGKFLEFFKLDIFRIF